MVKTVAGAIVATGIAAGLAAFPWETGVARANTQQTLNYSCTVPAYSFIIGSRPVSATLSWDFPGAVTVGQPTPPIPFTAAITIPSDDVQQAHQYLGVTSASGNGSASVTVAAPQGNIPLSISASAPSTNVPASGSVTVVVHPTFPSLTPTRPGVAEISLGTVTAHITPRNSSGGVAWPGTVTVTCTPQSGPSVLVASIPINPAPQVIRPAPTHPAAPKPRPTHHASRPSSPSPSPSPSASASPSPSRSSHPAAAPRRTASAPAKAVGMDEAGYETIGGASLAAVIGVAGLLWGLMRRDRRRLR